MALLSKKPAEAPAEPYHVPSLAECDDVYAGLLSKRAELNERLRGLDAEARQIEKEIAADPTPEVRPSVAALLGDGPTAKAANRKKLADVRADRADHEVASRAIEQRIRDAKTPAVRKAIALVRPEWDRRQKELCEALAVVEKAHRSLNDLAEGLEAEDIGSSHFGNRAHFLGDARDGHIARYLKEAGYVG
ncbi:hypothetical protein EOA46_22630 [Mesorhizobium sp. M1A.F.Ca.IN.022.05.2.1]|uniref:hypothetical protein n=1 Tax=unclassified Mesorhizobium TaxID=325217 RepID=UPI000FCBE5AC|nr:MULTISPECIES: hypothetical protein [unclassified Mesorhizobium]RUV89198.1 hypothetical protein EOA51_04620 [Mesorhizobium sp. M1A.F.Ca.IN.020.32.1.1]RUW07825.1 hypothetical protein EOA46_22630 [Mesorhizobium sp. M1A.F.Ca.IN.022.05.2.1]RWF81943.1 MAG: hypothetical protein EOQ35_11885 [Mesorhizobium sp.]RWG01357.1 MAG: hypothetical protein EOQ38_12340 [Mesorhizobium sp.]RWG76447.1 MAG: hypothetical protein EOQ68_22610 [Mesorhizobium sp.]